MADESRILGEDALIRILAAGRIQTTITAIKSLMVTFKADILREGYLQEKFDRHDMIFRGAAVELVIHPEGPEIFQMIDIITRRQRRELTQSQARINVVATYQFPNGSRPRVSIPDVVFGDIPVNFAARDQYVDIRLSGEANFPRLENL